MRLTLLVPYLFHFADVYPLPPALLRLKKAEREALSGTTLEAYLCQLFGLENQPIAALSAISDKLENTATRTWLRADLVHLAVQQNSMSVLPGQALEIQEQEVQAILTSLNALLSGEQLTLVAPHSERWYLQPNTAVASEFLALPLALGRPLPPQTIHGDDAKFWKRLQSEIQMTLHEHPVNESRQARGLLPINHLWIWGNDPLITTPQAPKQQLWGNHEVLHGLAELTQTTTQAPPQTFERWQQKAEKQASHLVILDSLAAPAHHDDLGEWVNSLAQLCKDWIGPALNAGLEELVIEAIEPENGCRYRLTPWSTWQFWKKTHVGY